MTDSTSADPQNVTYELTDSVAVISIDDGRANALGHPTLEGLENALDQAERDEAKAIVIAGRPGKFSAGFDLSVMTSGPTQARDLLERGARLGIRLFEFPRPVVLAVTGHALAMGGILLCCADVRVGAEGAFKIGLNEVRIGMPVPAFAVEVCRDRLSPRHFTAAIQLAHIHTPTEAREAGFLDEVVDPEQLMDRALEIGRDLAESLHPTPFRLTRETVRGGLASELRTGLAKDLESFNIEAP
ncbi:MAG TPA: crotonase/enoyl-CoA hydratase family protein [Microthrixaceae bacterium]|nr:crotonase/enoyl-CoA hydratase family protein [Microthrixaceae bacterium]